MLIATTLLATAFALLAPLSATAQRVVIGLVHDTHGEPLPGVTVRVAGMPGLGTATDLDGRYMLKLPDTSNYILCASMVGMKSDSASTRAAADSAAQRRFARHHLPKGKSANMLVINFTLREQAVGVQTVVVTATRTPKTLLDVPVVTRVIDAKEIRSADAATVQDLLEAEMPGIEFNYSMNQQVNVSLQGFGGNSVLFLVDGERLAGETLDNIDYSRLTLGDVGRVEVVKGAASSLYGSNAVGGVVNLISREQTEPWTLSVNGRIGSHNDQRLGGTLSLKRGRVSSSTSLQRNHTDAIAMPAPGDFGNLYATTSLNAKQRVGVEVGDKLRLTARASYFFRERESAVEQHDRYRDFGGGVKGEYTINEATDASLSYSFDQYDKSDYTLAGGLDVRDYSNVQHTTRAIANHTFGSTGTLTVGGDFMRDYLMSYQFSPEDHHRQYTADAFAQWDWAITTRLNAVCALRYDYYSEAAADHLSPKLNLMYRLDQVALRAGYASGFRAPTLKEMYMNFDMANIFMIYGNAALRPETSDNLQLSAEWTHNGYNLAGTAYYNHVKNRITTLWSQALNGMVYTNMEPMEIGGVDINASARWDNGLGARVGYVYTHERVADGGLLTSATRPHTATARIDYSRHSFHGTFNVALTGRVMSAVTCDEYTSLTDLTSTERRTYPAYSLWKLTVSQSYPKGITLALTLDNILNYRPAYYYNNSPATTGRTIAVSLTWDVDRSFAKSALTE
ncbi:MAG: TonB-dependent receptor [Bacteroidales bacterium]|nr:TonB-dependent receptor [Bacteroidales bacterium]